MRARRSQKCADSSKKEMGTLYQEGVAVKLQSDDDNIRKHELFLEMYATRHQDLEGIARLRPV
jgi:hypothetical protein